MEFLMFPVLIILPVPASGGFAPAGLFWHRIVNQARSIRMLAR
jgi:hypothetical protein